MPNPYSRAQVHFKLGEEIGEEGKNSQVYIAHDPQLDAELVIKQIEKKNIADANQYFEESNLLHKSAHTNVVPIHYACQDEDCIYLAMPFFQNGSLKKLMSQGMLTTREIIVLGTQFLSGLHHIHSKRLIHFDVKPDNVLISARGEALISDFGLAKQTTFSGQAGQDRIYGKMIPPEAFDTDQFTNRFDIYQAGLTLYRMCVGDQEFYLQYDSFFENGALNRANYLHAVRNAQFPNRSAYPEHIPQRLKNAIKRCLEPQIDKRFASVIELVNALAEIDGNTLDWKLEFKANGKEWTKSAQGKYYSIIVGNDSSATATRSVGDGAPRRIADYCLDRITPVQIRRFLGKY